METEDEPLAELAEAVLDGRPVDWTSAESTPGAPDREVVRLFKVVAGIAELHRSLASDIPEEKLERWGRLEILERIGQGSFGEVFRAWDSKLDREVAVKLLHAGMAQPEGATVLEEARLLARVRHPNVVTVFDADEIDGRVGLWMEFIRGRNLEQALAERGKFDDLAVTRIGIELCRALSAVHDAGLLHRDIKAQNLMQAGDGRLVLMDFGTGRELEVTPGSSVDAAGTPLYLAPEIFGGATATVRSDIYSAGVLLFHLLTGAYPVRGATIKEVGEAHARGQRLDVMAGAPGVNKALAAAIGQGIEPDPSKRFESARDMLATLENVQRRMERPRRAALIAAGFALAIILVGATAWLSRNDSPQPVGNLQALPFHARDWVLVAGFDNRTGEKLFDGTLDYALGLELSNSRRVNVVSRERVGDSLRLMRKPPDSPLDAGLAREVCLRDGGIRALLSGRVEKLGSGYLISVELMDPKQGTTLAGFRETSDGAGGPLAAVRRISDRVRVTLGEAPAPENPGGESLAKVTTTNLRALQLYSQADLLMWGWRTVGANWAAAEELLRQAVAEDPTFASAWIHLAWTVHNQDRPLAEFRPFLETALRLADTTTERERLFIRGGYYFMLGEREKAIAVYEALLSMYPDHSWAANEVCHLYDWMHDPRDLEKAVQVEARLADARPNDFWANWNAAYNFVTAKPDRARAGPYLRRASELITPEVRDQFPFQVNWVDLLPFTDSWVKADLATAAQEIDRVAAEIDSLGGTSRDFLAAQVALGYLTLGRIEAAARESESIVEPVLRNDMLAQIAYIRGDGVALREHLKSQGDWRLVTAVGWWDFAGLYESTLHLQVRAGLMSEAERYMKLPHSDGGDSPVLRAEMALARGDLAAGIRSLEDACKDRCGSELGTLLATALAKQGDVTRAIQVLERNSDRSHEVMSGGTGAYWPMARLELARLYRKAGRIADAQAVEAELSELLAYADPDHPVLLKLRRLQQS